MKTVFYCFIVILSMLLSGLNYAQITYTDLPAQLQLFPRNAQDSAQVDIAGTVDLTGYDSIIVEIDTNSVLWRRESQWLNYSGGSASFSFNPKIYTDTIDFSFEVILDSNGTKTSDTLIDRVVCGDVFFINGQSNAVARRYNFLVQENGDGANEWVRSFGNSSQTKYTDTTWRLASWKANREAAIGIWGMRLGLLIATNQGIPVCIIQQGQGGEAITYFTAGIGGDTLPQYNNYDRLLLRASNAGVTQDVKAIFWWQGENDTGDTTSVNAYRSRFLTLYNGWKTDYPNIQKVYTTQIHPGYGNYCDQIREIQRQIAEDSANIEIITPHNLDYFNSAHFSAPGYKKYAALLYEQVARDIYGSTDTTDINPPNIQNAYFTNSKKNVLVLEFDNTNSLTLKNDTTYNSTKYLLKDHFYFHNGNGTIDTAIVDTISVFTNKVRLSLTKRSSATKITYQPAWFFNPVPGVPDTVYEGPNIISSAGVAALTFYEYPIDTNYGDDPMGANLKAFLEGPYDTTGDSMSTALRDSLPLSQPYNTSPWNYSGPESVSTIPNNVVDWILVSIRTGTDATTAVDTCAAFILKDGSIVDTRGTGYLSFNVPPGNYYVVIHHRNHCAVMSSSAHTLNGTITLYNFTTSESQAYGSNPMRLLETGVYGLITGDANGNGQVQNDDKNSDWKTQVGTGGYKSADFDLNGQVQNDDKNTYWKSNVGLGTQVP